MATADQDVDMSNYRFSSSPELSSLPSDSPSEPGSPADLDQRRPSNGHRNDEIVVDATAAHFSLLQQPQQSAHMPAFSPEGVVRLTKDGVPRKKPGRKPGTAMKRSADSTVASSASGATTTTGSGTEPPKPKRARKPRDPNAPPVQRKKRASAIPAVSAVSAPVPETLAARSISSELHFQPKIELTSMRMDIDSRPNHPPPHASAAPPMHPRQPPLSMVDRMPKREALPSSMKSILNSDEPLPRPPPAAPASSAPVRSVGQSYDPIRSSNYDPVRETMLSRDPYGTGPLGSPRAPSQVANRASASPSIASLVDPAPVSLTRSPAAATTISHQVSPPPYNNAQPSRYRENIPSLPPSPSPSPAIRNMISSTSSTTKQQATGTRAKPLVSPQTGPAAASAPSMAQPSKTSSASAAKAASVKSETNGTKSHSRPPPPPPVPGSLKSTATKVAKATSTKAAASKAAAALSEAGKPAKTSNPTTSFRDVAMTGTGTARATTPEPAPLIKKFSSILQQSARQGGKSTAASTTSSPKMTPVKDDTVQPAASTASDLPALPGNGAIGNSNGDSERSILDFGKVLPGDESSAPSIILYIPLIQGETNKYVNFSKLAEKNYGWDALHPRLAAHRDRKARIAAASAALERNGSGRESGDEMTDDMQSGDEGSNDENGLGENGANGTNGVNASGPDEAPSKPVRKKRIFKEDEYDKDDDFVDDSELLWEEQAAASRDGFFVYSGPLVPEEDKPAADSAPPTKRGRGGRGSRGGAARNTARPAASRSAGGAGSRGGTTARKPRATKQEKEQREREKAADSEKANQASSKSATNGFNLIPGANPPFSAGMAVDA